MLNKNKSKINTKILGTDTKMGLNTTTWNTAVLHGLTKMGKK